MVAPWVSVSARGGADYRDRYLNEHNDCGGRRKRAVEKRRQPRVLRIRVTCRFRNSAQRQSREQQEALAASNVLVTTPPQETKGPGFRGSDKRISDSTLKTKSVYGSFHMAKAGGAAYEAWHAPLSWTGFGNGACFGNKNLRLFLTPREDPRVSFPIVGPRI